MEEGEGGGGMQLAEALNNSLDRKNLEKEGGEEIQSMSIRLGSIGIGLVKSYGL